GPAPPRRSPGPAPAAREHHDVTRCTSGVASACAVAVVARDPASAPLAGVGVDVHEAGGPEVDGGRRGLETVDAAYVAHRHHGGAIGVAVVLVDVVKRMRVDRGRPYGLDDTADDADRRVALRDAGVLQAIE